MEDDIGEADNAVHSEAWTLENLALFERLILDDPDAERRRGWFIARGRCLLSLGEFDKAERTFETARKFRVGASADIAAKQLEKVRARRADRDRAFALLDRSPQHLRLEADAEKDAERAFGFQVEARLLLVERHPTSTHDLVALGAAQRHNGEVAAALATYDRALALDDGLVSNSAAHVGRAAVLRDIGKRDEAEELLRSVLGRNGRSGHAALGLAGVLMDRYEDTRGSKVLVETERLLKLAWAAAPGTKEVQAAYGRFRSLTRRAPGLDQ